MLAVTDPNEAYRRSELDARIQGGRPADLVSFCLAQVVQGLGGAISAHGLSAPTQRSHAMTRALTALTALEMGVDRNAPMARALLHFYGSARHTLLESVTAFDVARLTALRADFEDVQVAFTAAA